MSSEDSEEINKVVLTFMYNRNFRLAADMLVSGKRYLPDGDATEMPGEMMARKNLCGAIETLMGIWETKLTKSKYLGNLFEEDILKTPGSTFYRNILDPEKVSYDKLRPICDQVKLYLKDCWTKYNEYFDTEQPSENTPLTEMDPLLE